MYTLMSKEKKEKAMTAHVWRAEREREGCICVYVPISSLKEIIDKGSGSTSMDMSPEKKSFLLVWISSIEKKMVSTPYTMLYR